MRPTQKFPVGTPLAYYRGMERDQFERAVLSTRTLLEAAFGGVAIGACRVPDDPTQAAHLSWMLATSISFIREGKVEKANRWLGYVQGVIAAKGYATLDELKRANMPEGAEFDAQRV